MGEGRTRREGDNRGLLSLGFRGLVIALAARQGDGHRERGGEYEVTGAVHKPSSEALPPDTRTPFVCTCSALYNVPRFSLLVSSAILYVKSILPLGPGRARA